jgi:methyl-accepting chemotaxis protein
MISIRHVLTLLAAAGGAACAIITAASLWGETQSGAAFDRALVAKDVTADILPPPLYLIELRLVLSQALEGSLPPAQAKTETERLEKEYQARVEYWHAHPPYGLERHLFGTQHDAGLRFIRCAHEVLDALEHADHAAAQAALQRAHVEYMAHRTGVDATVQASTTFADDASAGFATARTHAAQARWLTFALAAVTLVALGHWARRAVWSAIGGEPAQAAAVAQAVAAGDLTVRVTAEPGDTRSVMAAMQRMCESLAQVVGEVRDSSRAIARNAENVASGHTDLSQRTEQQAASLEETAASMEELSSTVRLNADAAHEAARLAGTASDVAARGCSVVSEVVTTMNSISDSSRRISEISGLIDGIAFQTNLLALNAAVEAARAGEQGRGFLAQRSAEAAREIKKLVSISASTVETGSRLADQAGATMDDIVVQVKEVTRLIHQISSATAEQSCGIEAVSTAVSQLDIVTQQNSALVGEGTAAADDLNQQAARLVHAVDKFRLTA